jgi:hypothetical protein
MHNKRKKGTVTEEKGERCKLERSGERQRWLLNTVGERDEAKLGAAEAECQLDMVVLVPTLLEVLCGGARHSGVRLGDILAQRDVEAGKREEGAPKRKAVWRDPPVSAIDGFKIRREGGSAGWAAEVRLQGLGERAHLERSVAGARDRHKVHVGVTAMGFCLGLRLGFCLGLRLGFCLGLRLGLFLGLRLGLFLGLRLGLFLGLRLGFVLGFVLGSVLDAGATDSERGLASGSAIACGKPVRKSRRAKAEAHVPGWWLRRRSSGPSKAGQLVGNLCMGLFNKDTTNGHSLDRMAMQAFRGSLWIKRRVESSTEYQARDNTLSSTRRTNQSTRLCCNQVPFGTHHNPFVQRDGQEPFCDGDEVVQRRGGGHHDLFCLVRSFFFDFLRTQQWWPTQQW